MTTSPTGDSGMQERVFAFLTAPATHPQVHRIDTHAASVFLEGDRALKIKRAVRFPFLDYSTLEKRKAACDEEININRQFAPQIYRRVVPITQDSDGSLDIDGDGTPVEFAVEMTRFDERQTIDHLAEAGEPDSGLVNAIADAIGASHAVAPRAAAEPWVESIPTFIEGNTTAFRTSARFPETDIDDLGAASQSAYLRIRELLRQRGRDGYLRRRRSSLSAGCPEPENPFWRGRLRPLSCRCRELLCCALTSCESNDFRSAKPTSCPRAHTGRRLPHKSIKPWCSARSGFLSKVNPLSSTRYSRMKRNEIGR